MMEFMGKTATTESRRRLLRRFGLSRDEYDEIMAYCGGVCQICGKPETRVRGGVSHSLCVDHDHTTGRVVGLLCFRCNSAVGLFEEDPELLIAAASYLLRTGKRKK